MWIVEAQKQRGDRRLATAARADNADALTDLGLERQPVEGVAAAARIGEMHVGECDARDERRSWSRAAFRQRRGGLQQGIDADRRRLADNAIVQHGAEIAQGAEYLGARHQHDEQCWQRHQAVGQAVNTERKRRRRADPYTTSMMPRAIRFVPSIFMVAAESSRAFLASMWP